MKNKNFDLTECGFCCGHEFYVRCDKTKNHAMIEVSKCNNREDYSVEIVPLDPDIPCEVDFPKNRELLEGYLTQHYTRLENNDPCSEYFEQRDICPECNNRLEPGLYDDLC